MGREREKERLKQIARKEGKPVEQVYSGLTQTLSGLLSPLFLRRMRAGACFLLLNEYLCCFLTHLCRLRVRVCEIWNICRFFLRPLCQPLTHTYTHTHTPVIRWIFVFTCRLAHLRGLTCSDGENTFSLVVGSTRKEKQLYNKVRAGKEGNKTIHILRNECRSEEEGEKGVDAFSGVPLSVGTLFCK